MVPEATSGAIAEAPRTVAKNRKDEEEDDNGHGSTQPLHHTGNSDALRQQVVTRDHDQADHRAPDEKRAQLADTEMSTLRYLRVLRLHPIQKLSSS